MSHVARTFPKARFATEVERVTKASGIQMEALRILMDGADPVHLDRERIAWVGESPELLAEAIEAKLRLHGVNGHTP